MNNGVLVIYAVAVVVIYHFYLAADIFLYFLARCTTSCDSIGAVSGVSHDNISILRAHFIK